MQRGIKILLVADAWANLALGMIGPIYAIFVEKIGGDILDASWAYFVFTFTSGVVMYLISRWENRVYHKERLIAIGYGITAIGCFSYIFVNSQFTLLVTQVILGFSVAIISPAFDALYAHYVNVKSDASDWGAWEAMGYLVAALAALAGGYIAYGFGFRALFITMFIFALLGAVASLGLLRGDKAMHRRS